MIFNNFLSNYHLFIYVVFALISLSMLKLNRIRQDLQEELYQRIRSWWWMLLILFSACLAGKLMLSLLLVIIGILALKELKVNGRLSPGATITLGIGFLSVQVSMLYLTPMMSAALCFITSLCIYFQLKLSTAAVMKETMAEQGLKFHVSTTFAILNLSLLSLQMLNQSYGETRHFGLFLFLIFCAQFNDVGQYICGKTFGKTPLSPNISPSKTLEGAIGGTVITTITAVFLSQLITPFSVMQALLCSVIICILGIGGDLYTSKLKRGLKIKDMGNIIPGHGGILDRIDSLLLSAPVFTVLVIYYMVK